MATMLPARLDLDGLRTLVDEQRADGAAAQDDVSRLFGFSSWEALRSEVERRVILNAVDVERAWARIRSDPTWATRDLLGWCDHKGGAAPLNYMAMLRFDAPRLGLSPKPAGTGEMARLLLNAGAPVDGNPGESETPLMTAASYGDADIARVLVEAGADLDALATPDSGGVAGGSALLHAAVFGMTDVLDTVVAAGAEVRSLVEAAAAGDIGAWPTDEAGDVEKLRALIMAADHQRLDVIDQLLAAGTPIDGVDPMWGRQALRLCAEHGRPASTRHLLARGADPTLSDDEGNTALDLCQGQHRYLPGRHHDEVAEILRDALSRR
ncbi:MAG: ankyrin repeat domain-containing protein [Solirubrobacteraceae bacterium]